MPDRYDVVIVGGGPAGCATALAALDSGIERVLVVEASDFSIERIGESLPPDTHLLFGRLGLLASFEDEGHDRCFGSSSSWGSDKLGFNDFLTNPHGQGWHLDRLRFDRWLAAHVVTRGIEMRRGTFLGLEPVDAHTRRVTLGGPEPFVVDCRFVVDATGRQARVARRMGANPRFDDQLVCVSAFFDVEDDHQLTRLTMLEAVEHGWWYAALLPGGRATAAVASDASIVTRLRLNHTRDWLSHLERTSHVGPALAGCRLTGAGPRVWSAPSMLLGPPAGTGWLAVGDAASAFDPISSQGIYKAIADGLAAAPAIAAWLAGDPQPLVDYRTAIADRYLDYLQQRSYFYNAERRWAEHPFWKRRQRQLGTPIASELSPILPIETRTPDRSRPDLQIEPMANAIQTKEYEDHAECRQRCRPVHLSTTTHRYLDEQESSRNRQRG